MHLDSEIAELSGLKSPVVNNYPLKLTFDHQKDIFKRFMLWKKKSSCVEASM